MKKTLLGKQCNLYYGEFGTGGVQGVALHGEGVTETTQTHSKTSERISPVFMQGCGVVLPGTRKRGTLLVLLKSIHSTIQ